MGNVYGKPRAKPVAVNPLDAVAELQKKLTELDKSVQQKTLESKQWYAKAKQYAQDKNPELAKLMLQRKKRVDERITSLLKMQLLVETQLSSVQSAITNKGILNVTAVASRAMKETTVEDAEKIMENVREQIDNIGEISSILSEPLVPVPEVDDELEELQKEIGPAPLPLPVLPAAPTVVHVAPKPESSMEREIAELEPA